MLILTSKNSVNPVAKSFFNKVRAAGGDVVDKAGIIEFTKRLSRVVHPSLWVCWPLISSQNIGTGTTAFSLGGFGDYNGTLFNGPTWTINGISVESATNVSVAVTIPISSTSAIITINAITDDSIVTRRIVGSYLAGFGQALSSDYPNIYVDMPEVSSSRWWPDGSYVLTAENTFSCFMAGANGTTRFASKNGGTVFTATRETNFVDGINTFGIMGGGEGVHGCPYMITSMTMYFKCDISAVSPTVYNIYKLTLGKNLGLP